MSVLGTGEADTNVRGRSPRMSERPSMGDMENFMLMTKRCCGRRALLWRLKGGCVGYRGKR